MRPDLRAVALILSASGCVGILSDDAGSVSTGFHVGGALVSAAALPWEGTGFEIPLDWRPRDTRYTTDEVLAWLMGAAARVAQDHPDARVRVGDISRRGGGPLPRHRSHEGGRDIDIFLLAVDEAGRPFTSARHMLRFGADGWARAWSTAGEPPPPASTVPRVRFDERRNWALVRSLLSDARTEVQWIFVNAALAQRLLDHAAAAGEDPALVGHARAVFHQPSGVDPHDDHMHARVFCDLHDRVLGCRDRAPIRWWKKRWKWLSRTAASEPHRRDR